MEEKKVAKMFEKIRKSRESVNKKTEYLNVDVCCPDEESVMMDYEMMGKLTLEKVIEIHNSHECCGCDQCNIPEFI